MTLVVRDGSDGVGVGEFLSLLNASGSSDGMKQLQSEFTLTIVQDHESIITAVGECC